MQKCHPHTVTSRQNSGCSNDTSHLRHVMVTLRGFKEIRSTAKTSRFCRDGLWLCPRDNRVKCEDDSWFRAVCCSLRYRASGRCCVRGGGGHCILPRKENAISMSESLDSTNSEEAIYAASEASAKSITTSMFNRICSLGSDAKTIRKI